MIPKPPNLETLPLRSVTSVKIPLEELPLILKSSSSVNKKNKKEKKNRKLSSNKSKPTERKRFKLEKLKKKRGEKNHGTFRNKHEIPGCRKRSTRNELSNKRKERRKIMVLITGELTLARPGTNRPNNSHSHQLRKEKLERNMEVESDEVKIVGLSQKVNVVISKEEETASKEDVEVDEVETSKVNQGMTEEDQTNQNNNLKLFLLKTEEIPSMLQRTL